MMQPEQQRNAEKQLQPDRHADDFGEVACRDGQFAEHPEKNRNRKGIMVAARLRQVAASGDAELERADAAAGWP